MHVEIAYPRWRGKRSRHSRCMRNAQFYASGKRPMDKALWWIMIAVRDDSSSEICPINSYPTGNLHISRCSFEWRFCSRNNVDGGELLSHIALMSSRHFVVKLKEYHIRSCKLLPLSHPIRISKLTLDFFWPVCYVKTCTIIFLEHVSGDCQLW